MRLLILSTSLAAGALAAAAPAPKAPTPEIKPAATKPAPTKPTAAKPTAAKPTAAKPVAAKPGKPAPKAAPKPMAFAPLEFDLAPGETYLAELFVASPTGKAVQGALTYAPAEGLSVKADDRWTGKVPPWGLKTYPKITAAPTASGDLPVKATLEKGGEATLTVRVVAPTIEPVPGFRQLGVKIQNPFRKRLLTGRIKASNPDRFLEDVTTREFKIPPGETGEVVFPLPGYSAAEEQTYDFTLEVESYQGYRFKKTYPLEFPADTKPVQESK